MTTSRSFGHRAYLGAAALVAALILLFSNVFANAAPVKAASPPPPASGTTVMLNPNRIADSRMTLSFPTFQPGWSQDLQVAGRGGVPLTGVAAVVLNVTAVGPQRGGYLTVWPFGTTRQWTSSVNFAAGQNIANTVIVRVSSDGTISIYNGSGGNVDVLVDVEGYIPS